MLFQTGAAAAGPLAATLEFDTAGSYAGEFYLLMLVLAVAPFLMFPARRTVPPEGR